MEYPKRKQIRLKDYDYSQNGAYFVTICTKDRKPLLWNVGASCGRPSDSLPLSNIGQLVNDEINSLSTVYNGVSIEDSVIMPNHIHMIISMDNSENGRPQYAPTISRIVQQFKGSVSKQAGYPVWQKSFYEHIIRNEQDYLAICDYIDTNPQKWNKDKYYDEP